MNVGPPSEVGYFLSAVLIIRVSQARLTEMAYRRVFPFFYAFGRYVRSDNSGSESALIPNEACIIPDYIP